MGQDTYRKASEAARRQARSTANVGKKPLSPKQERVYGEMFNAIEKIGRRLEKTEVEKDRLVHRLDSLESQAELDNLTGKYYLPVRTDDLTYNPPPRAPKWIAAATVASICIAVISLGIVLTKEPTISDAQLAKLQLAPAEFANLNPQSPYWERLDVAKKPANTRTENVQPRSEFRVTGAQTSNVPAPNDNVLTRTSEQEDMLIGNILEGLEAEELVSEDVTLAELSNGAQDDSYIKLFEKDETDRDAIVTDIEPALGTTDTSVAKVSDEVGKEIEMALAPDVKPEPAIQTPVQKTASQAKSLVDHTKPVALSKPKKQATRPTVSVASLAPDEALPEKAKDLEKRAFEGIPEAQHDIATLYAAGNVIPLDYKRAVYWFKKSAEGGIANAHYNLGVMSHQGLGGKVDLTGALGWYKNAAELGHPEALYNLGIAYIEGIGTKQDVERGAGYFKRAAYAGVAQAAFNLGILYESSFMGGVDKDKAKEWYAYAAETGHEAAQDAFTRLAGSTAYSSASVNDVSIAQGIEPASGSIMGGGESDTIVDVQASRVAEIQQFLINKKLLPGEADGVFGARTEDAIRSYQRMAGLSVTGQPTQELVSYMRTNEY